MKKHVTIAAVAVTILMMLAAAAHAADNTYSGATSANAGTLLYLESATGAVAARAETDGKGNATFRDLKPGNYTVLLPDTTKLKPGAKLTFTITVTNTSTPPIIGTVTVGKGGSPTYLLDKSGRKAVATITKVGQGTLVVTLEIFDRWGNL